MYLLRSSNAQSVKLPPGANLGLGGEARIYAVADNAELAAKIYHRPSPEQAAKVAAMVANPPLDPMVAQGHISIAWPLDMLLSGDGAARFRGFLMPRVKGARPIMDFYHPKTRRRKHPLFNYQYLLRTARNLAACVSALHERGYVIGDLNESNILVGDTALVTLVDTDSFQVPDAKSGRVYRCRVGKPEFTPPELQAVSFAQTDRLPDHDLFGLAVLIFQLLMEGTHPFAGRPMGLGESPSLEQRIAAGQFPYDLTRVQSRSLPMVTAPPFAMLHPALREVFLRCFLNGHTQPALRPSAQEWQWALLQAEDALVKCPENSQHRYGNHLTECPWCQRRRLLRGLDPFPSRESIQNRRHLRPEFRPRQRRLTEAQSVAMPLFDLERFARRRNRRVLLFGLTLGLGLLLYWSVMLAMIAHNR